MNLLDKGKREPQKRRSHYQHLNPFEYFLDDENGECEEFREIGPLGPELIWHLGI